MTVEEAQEYLRSLTTCYETVVPSPSREEPVVQCIAAAVSVLLTAYEAREADSKRLDGLDALAKGRQWIQRKSSFGGYHLHPCDINGHNTVREAIDAALSGTETP